jgi:RNA polymerase sigma-70 factor (ECF subfamily)
LKHNNIVGKHIKAELLEKESEIFFEDHVIEEETHRLFYQAIQELPEKCREIIMMSLEGLKNNEIAKELNISINTIKTQKRIAYNQLRIQLKDILAISPLILQYFFSK